MSVTQNWLAAILTLMLFSYLWKENAVYRLAEHLMVGLAAAHGMVMSWDNYLKPTITDTIPKQGEYHLIIPAILGILIYARYSKQYQWVARIPMSFWVGYGVGYTLAFVPRTFLLQVIDSFIALDSFDNVLFFILLAATIVYFMFTVRKEGTATGIVSTVGRYAIMIGLGASFGNTVQGRISLFLGRLQFLLGDWLGLIKIG
ncbi:MAG: hypothetical protein Q8P50_09770 [Bacillota bacterium]|nr:hypothetical protein [Bacillota bacterium]